MVSRAAVVRAVPGRSHPIPVNHPGQPPKIPDDSTTSLVSVASEMSENLRNRVGMLLEACAGQGNENSERAPVANGFNDRLQAIRENLQQSHDLVAKLGSYLGFEV